MSHNYPFQPKNSMCWNTEEFSYEEAAQAFDKDGNLLSLKTMSTAPADDTNGLPNEKSMYWTGETNKTDVVSNEPEVVDFTSKEEASNADAHFVPVRYAIDQQRNNDGSITPFGLPEGWNGNGLAARRLTSNQYTLRQLRDGWLYVYNYEQKTIDEYQVEGTQFTHFKLSDSEDPSNKERGQKQASTGFLSYPNNSVLSLLYSKHRWSWIMFQDVLENIGRYSSYMQTVVLSRDGCPAHVGDIELLSKVADIEESAVDDGRFSASYVGTFDSQGDENGHSEIKPIASVSDFISEIPEEEVAYVVAVNDHLVDCRDLATQFVGAATPYRFFDENFSNQWTLMQTAMQMTLFGSMDDIKFPPSVTRNNKELEFYLDMSRFYDAGEKTSNAYKSQSPSSDAIARIYKGEQSEIAKSIQSKYSIPASHLNKYENWLAQSKWRKQLDWEVMLTEMDELQKERDELEKEAFEAKKDFKHFLNAFTPFMIERQCDLWGEETQTELQDANLHFIEAFTFLASVEDKEWLTAQCEKPTSIIPLYTAGFSHTLFKKLEELLPKHDDNDGANKSNHESIIQGVDTPKTIQDGFYIEVAGLSNTTTMYSKIVDFMAHASVSETEIFKKLGETIQQLNHVLIAASGGLIQYIAKLGVSPIAQASVLLLPAMPTGYASRTTSLYRITFAEKLAHKIGINVAEGFAQNFDKWQKRMAQVDVDIKASTTIVENKSISVKQKQAALKEMTRLQKVKAANVVGFPQRFEWPSDIKGAIHSMSEERLKGVAVSAKNHFADVGGLGFLALVFNLISLNDSLRTIRQDGLATTDNYAEIGQKIAYTATAWAGIRTGTAWAKIQGNPELLKSTVSAIEKARLEGVDDWLTKLPLKDIKIFTRWLGVTAVLGTIASVTELLREADKLEGMYGIERKVQYGKLLSLGGLSAIGVGQGIGAISGRLAIGVMFGPGVMAALLVLTIFYIAFGYQLDKFKQDEYQKWLALLPWGTNPKRVKWSESKDVSLRLEENTNILNTALNDLKRIQLQPVIYQEPQLTYVKSEQSYPAAVALCHAIDVRFSVPRGAGSQSLRITTNSNASMEELEGGEWLSNVDLVTLEKIQIDNKKSILSEQRDIYQVTLPIDNEINYLAIQVDYLMLSQNSEEEIQYSYQFQYAITQKAVHTAISDSEKLNKWGSQSLNKSADIVIEHTKLED
ncbi:T6SS effector BTH_I2691 family protein [Aliivibrio logei]|uniref:Toxin VasX N-terminal region domain-containing protein n=1 Tax=Aliivibrio logei 5S-186 TaxID=626086 RepID=A0ABX3AXL2_ALILO|nr:T6SS effector BTH_I2691 family protein [Aliivibrio logei]OEF19464.1 hypothetical protein A1Q5_17780 [Aliivibrio logei 5S-186]